MLTRFPFQNKVQTVFRSGNEGTYFIARVGQSVCEKNVIKQEFIYRPAAPGGSKVLWSVARRYINAAAMAARILTFAHVHRSATVTTLRRAGLETRPTTKTNRPRPGMRLRQQNVYITRPRDGDKISASRTRAKTRAHIRQRATEFCLHWGPSKTGHVLIADMLDAYQDMVKK